MVWTSKLDSRSYCSLWPITVKHCNQNLFMHCVMDCASYYMLLSTLRSFLLTNHQQLSRLMMNYEPIYWWFMMNYENLWANDRDFHQPMDSGAACASTKLHWTNAYDSKELRPPNLQQPPGVKSSAESVERIGWKMNRIDYLDKQWISK